MRSIHTLAACSAMALLSADTGGGASRSEGDAAAADKAAADKAAKKATKAAPVAKSDAAPHPLSADQKAPAQGRDGGGVAGVGLAQGSDVNAPTNLDDAEHPKKGRVAVVWAQPGHEMVAIGALLSVPEDEAENLRAAGRARFASEAEVEAAGDAIVELSGI